MSTTQAMALEKLSLAVDMNIFQELLDLDSPSELFSKDIVNEFLILAPEALSTMDESLYHVDLSQLGKSSQSLRCASMVLGLSRLEKACVRIETILALGIDLHYIGIGVVQICEILGHVVKAAHAHFESAKTALSVFYGIPLSSSRLLTADDDVSDVSELGV